MMKIDHKIANIVAGVIFAWRAFNSGTTIVSQVASGNVFYISPIYLVMTLYGIAVSAVMGHYALRQKARSKVLSVLGAVYIGYVIVNFVTALPHSMNAGTLISMALLIAAFVLSQKACGGTVFHTDDTKSEAVKARIQAEKQNTIYDEQLRDGILTQEEYDQIMRNKNQMSV